MIVQALTTKMMTTGRDFGIWEKNEINLIKLYIRHYFIIDFLVAFPLASIILEHVKSQILLLNLCVCVCMCV